MLDITRNSGPTYLAVANAYAEAIERGELQAGARLPPQRDLARELGVTVGTISRAYALMKKRNLVSGEVGRGTFVCGTKRTVARAETAAESALATTRVVDLSCFHVPASETNSILGRTAAEVTARAARHSMLKYPPWVGLLSHRADGARWLSRYGVDVSPAQVIVCAGAHLALNVALCAFVRRGDSILAESVTYAGLLATCAMHEIGMRGVEIDDDGLIPEALERACAAGDSRILVVQPTMHNPTTASMPLERRRAIAELAIKYGLLVIEHDTAGCAVLDRLPPIASFAPENTIYITSISKCISPTLRLGYLAAPMRHIDRLERAMFVISVTAPPLVSDIMSALLSSGAAEQIVRRNMAETERRHEIACDMLKGYQLRSKPGALFAWLTLPPIWRAHEFVAAAYRQGVIVRDGGIFQVDRSSPVEAIRISVGSAPAQDLLRRGLGVIVRLLDQQPEAWTPVV